MLIGSDYYWELTTGEILQGRSGSTAINTCISWVLSDPMPLPEERETGQTGLVNSRGVPDKDEGQGL